MDTFEAKLRAGGKSLAVADLAWVVPAKMADRIVDEASKEMLSVRQTWPEGHAVAPVVFTGKLELEGVEELGQARITRVEGPIGSNLFVRVQSWDETAKHESILAFEGKKVKITLELSGEEDSA